MPWFPRRKVRFPERIAMLEYAIVAVFFVEILVFLWWCQSGQWMDAMWKRHEGDRS